MTGHGHACPECEGRGDVRVKGRPGYERRPCPRCGGSGQLVPIRQAHPAERVDPRTVVAGGIVGFLVLLTVCIPVGATFAILGAES